MSSSYHMELNTFIKQKKRFVEARKKVYTLENRSFEGGTFEGLQVISFHTE